eukprot:CAMPEP_0184068974 /NCGR_PEP_ID=MMETSP0957-20130417/38397_1 /TAXON_ID=627963 /ORGANISM="Aplanochytrium sp, Strain PBS07" /LENGTH=44 /DNA_ID= /DNA_START= /DNA_END= /DNA_ORIENTATION=
MTVRPDEEKALTIYTKFFMGSNIGARINHDLVNYTSGRFQRLSE